MLMRYFTKHIMGVDAERMLAGCVQVTDSSVFPSTQPLYYHQ